jgi:hypothetical protein
VSSRNTRFVERVRCERAALACVNNTFFDAPPLGALSGPAINTWYLNAGAFYDREKLQCIVGLLRELSARLDIQASNSREVFEFVESELDIDTLLGQLRAECLV